jgi:hypothetical protein
MKWLRRVGDIHPTPGRGRGGGISEVFLRVKGSTIGLSAGEPRLFGFGGRTFILEGKCELSCKLKLSK